MDLGSRDTYSKEGKEGVGYDDEIILPYHNLTTLSNNADGCAGKFDVHTILVDVFFTDLFQFIDSLVVSKVKAIVFSVKHLVPIERRHTLTGYAGTNNQT